MKRTTLLPINCYYGISVLAKNEAVLISISRYTVFSVYRPTLVPTQGRYVGWWMGYTALRKVFRVTKMANRPY